jgi:hypothetical protein
MKSPIIVIAILLLVFAGCSSTNTPVSQQSLTFTYHNLPPNRSGETYAIWVEVPPSAASLPRPEHGLNKSKFVATFIVNDTGMIGPDLSQAKTRIGVDYSVIIAVEISIERADSIGAAPSSIYLASSSITGSSNVGTAVLSGNDGYAFGGSPLAPISGTATLASSPKTPTKFTNEVYLMNASDANTTSPSLSKLAFLPGKWRYGVWATDSISSPPVYTFLGYVIDSASNDSKALGDNYHYPGGKTPNDMTDGKSGVLVNLEPDVLTADPTIPFPAAVLWGHVPQGQPAFTPFQLTNISGTYPQVNVKIMR